MQGAILSTQPELEYVAEIIGKSRAKIEKAKEPLSKEQIVKVVERVEVALSHAKSQSEYRRNLQDKQAERRSQMISRLEDDEINLARTRIENRMFRAPIILIPFALLIAAFGLAVLGVIDIKGQKLDVDNIVNKAVTKLTLQLETEGSKALTKINRKLEEKTDEISMFDVKTRIENAVSLHVDDKGKNTLAQIESKLIKFNEQFPDKILSDTIKTVNETASSTSSLKTSLDTLESKLVRLNQEVLPLSRALDELKDADPTSFKTISVLSQRSQWMVYAGVIGLGMGAISLLLTTVLMLKRSRG